MDWYLSINSVLSSTHRFKSYTKIYYVYIPCTVNPLQSPIVVDCVDCLITYLHLDQESNNIQCFEHAEVQILYRLSKVKAFQLRLKSSGLGFLTNQRPPCKWTTPPFVIVLVVVWYFVIEQEGSVPSDHSVQGYHSVPGYP